MDKGNKNSKAQIVLKPWGHEEIWAQTSKYVGKILHIKKGHRLSLQYHEVKEETLKLLSGSTKLEVGENSYLMEPGDTHHIAPGTHHRIRAMEDSMIMEVSTPELEDVIRISDDYGRLLK